MAPIVTLLNGDSIELMANISNQALLPKEGKIFKAHACVTDPPYGINFDGNMDEDGSQSTRNKKGWDTFRKTSGYATISDDAAQFALFTERWIRAVQEILMTGAHAMIFSADRTIGRVGLGMELANLEIIRMVAWHYASGQVKTKTDLRPGMEPILIGRYLGSMTNQEDLMRLFKQTGRGQLHAQTLKAEDGQHPTNVMFDESFVEAYESIAETVAAHPGSFFVTKPSPKDRDWGCDALPTQQKLNRLSHMTSNYTGKVVKAVMAKNIHPTVKPIELMRRMIDLVTLPGHTVIDPFMGSGTTGVAAVLSGRNFVGIERDPEYFKIAEARVRSAVAEVSK